MRQVSGYQTRLLAAKDLRLSSEIVLQSGNGSLLAYRVSSITSNADGIFSLRFGHKEDGVTMVRNAMDRVNVVCESYTTR